RLAARIDADDRHLDHAVCPGPHAGRLEVEDGHRHVSDRAAVNSVRKDVHRVSYAIAGLDHGGQRHATSSRCRATAASASEGCVAGVLEAPWELRAQVWLQSRWWVGPRLASEPAARTSGPVGRTLNATLLLSLESPVARRGGSAGVGWS